MKLLIRAGDRILEPHRLGLRAGEVVALRLEDLDWRNATVRVRARKTGHGALLSLPGEVGAALAGYLQHARPDTRARQVFVLHRLRVGAPISSSIVGRAVDNALRHAGMVAPMSGANLLRHSLATAVSRWSRKSSTRCASRSASCSAEGDLPTRCSTKPNNNSKALLGFDLPPRVRDFKDMIFHRPAAGVRYARIDALFGDPINWRQIEDHWRDLMRVVISIREGKLSSVTLLRRLRHDSKKNKIYRAFRELGPSRWPSPTGATSAPPKPPGTCGAWSVSAHELSFTIRSHVTLAHLNKAIAEVVNA